MSLYIPHGRMKTCRTQHGGTREYLCTCTSDSWSEPGETCAECEMAGEDFEDDMPFDFYEWQEMHLDAEEALDADRAKLIALGADPGPTMSEVFGHASDSEACEHEWEWRVSGSVCKVCGIEQRDAFASTEHCPDNPVDGEKS